MGDNSRELGARVRVLYRGEGDAYRYRCLHLKEQLTLLGLSCHVQEFRPGEGLRIVSCDLLVMHRMPLDRFLRREVRRLQQSGTVVLFDTDDLVFDVGEALSFSKLIGDPWLKRALYEEDLKGMSLMLQAADGAIVATEALAAHARQWGKRAWVHRNAFSLEMLSAAEAAFRGRRHRGKSVVIGYAAGTPTHERDFAVVEPILREILERHENTEVRLIGNVTGSEAWGGASRRVSRVPFTSWQQLPSVLADLDVNLAPVELGRPFCEAKSEIKYVEAALVRVATVASSTGAFSYAIRDGHNGFIAKTQAEWRDALERLVVDPDLRTRVGRNAYDDVVRRYHPAVRAAELQQTLGEISTLRPTERPGFGGGTKVVENQVEAGGPLDRLDEPLLPRRRDRSHLGKAWYSLRYDGPRLFALRVLSFLATRTRGRNTANPC